MLHDFKIVMFNYGQIFVFMENFGIKHTVGLFYRIMGYFRVAKFSRFCLKKHGD